MNEILVLNGDDLTLDVWYKAVNEGVKLDLSNDSIDKINKSYETVRKFVQAGKPVYGITTGFGSLRDKFISKEDTVKLQENLIKSHAVGVGEALPLYLAKGMLLLRINTLIKGYSGVSLELIRYLIDMYNRGFIAKVPSKGSLGASGDLCALSHLISVYLGDGEMYDPELEAYNDASVVSAKYNLPRIQLDAKSGLALNNGTPLMTSYLASAVYQSKILFDNAISIAATTTEALKGTHRAFYHGIHEARNHPGQIEVSMRMRSLLKDSESHEVNAKDKIQDAYSIRCGPQIMGPVLEVIRQAEVVVNREMNSATDNPLIIDDDAYSGGNFHGQILAMQADFLAIALTTLGNLSERRIERLVNPDLSGLPAFLVGEGAQVGLNSGCMILQYTAASLCGENRTLSNSASVHSINSCQAFEDHVSQGPNACRKLMTILENTKQILAIELFCAVQAAGFTAEKKSTAVEKIIEKVRRAIPKLIDDRYLKTDIDKCLRMLDKSLL